ncbi:hypothetical protein CR205_18590 [Alteribacter lacisalsi]|uniref:Rhodanese-like domain-containing protein n=1 Tax=Alteribacter lacisalsi TaxID=2045244 RepID=A0A2W0HFF6_9BACI|nr:rhodanese-like domain-containing protein [Alteribacter lacisalsi]PYZ95539.1 hypothetical protein CR205_18590 [Alteribacter lacisalsi]
MLEILLVLTAATIAGRFLYRRYMPLFRVSCVSMDTLMTKKDARILDIRDYQTVHTAPVEGAVNIPMPYMYRQYMEAGTEPVYLVASDMVDVHLAARFLKKRGIQVKGFSIKNSTYVCRQQTQEV